MNFALIGFALLLLAHYVADFQLQPRWMATGKSEHLRILFAHIGVHFIVFFLVGWGLFGHLLPALTLTSINAGLHALVDWNIWRGYKRRVIEQKWGWIPPGATLRDGKMTLQSGEVRPLPEFRFWEDDRFWLTIGIDQLLHGLSMVLALYVASLI